MKRFVALLLLAFAIGVTVAESAPARRVVVRRARPAGPHRTTVIVRRGWPLRRPLRVVVVHPLRHPVLVETHTYLGPLAFAAVRVATPPADDALVWEDTETLTRDEDWTEFTLDCDTRGTRLWFEVAGRAEVDWAEVVFENGEARVVDFGDKAQGPGLYSLLDFPEGRKVDHVRMVARARSDESRITLRMEK
jgi:hypothetical protein